MSESIHARKGIKTRHGTQQRGKRYRYPSESIHARKGIKTHHYGACGVHLGRT